MSSPPSASNAFGLLDERIRRWIWEQKWEALRSAQEEAIPAILGGVSDVIVSAPTSTGKTEAAFLPILTRILGAPETSVQALYIGPLKALINDQFGRLDALCERLEIPVYRWHGDVSSSMKARLVKTPRGILLITPESLEALLMRQGRHVEAIFKHLQYVVVDETHSFIGNERGAQLRSLLHRVEAQIGHSVPRIGLSATLSEPVLAAEFLRPGKGKQAVIIVDEGTGMVKAQLKAFYKSAKVKDEPDHEISTTGEVVDHLMKVMRGHHNLVFCNRKSEVETYADALSQRCQKMRLLDEFCTHHGNLSKEIRESTEARLRSREQPVTCICTSTLEMGIDIGAMRSIGQIGPPPTVASLRQRVGRSGRRGEAAILRMVDIETAISAKSTLEDRLHLKLFQSAAALELMAEGWCEPPDDRNLHLSTCVQQIMSVIVQRGGARPPFLHNLLIAPGGPFSRLGQEGFIKLLRSMKDKGLIRQMDDGTLLLSEKGEKIAEHYSFYAAFSTPEEYSLVADGKPLGTMPLVIPVKVGDPLLFGGRRWEILDIDDTRKVILLRQSRGGKAPRFEGGEDDVHCRIRARMRQLYHEEALPAFLDPTAKEMFTHARAAYLEFGLDRDQVVDMDQQTMLFHWRGDLEASTLRLILERSGLVVDPDPAILVVDASFETTLEVLREILDEPPPMGLELAAQVKNKLREKFDWALGDELLNEAYAQGRLDIPGAIDVARELVASVDAP